MDKEAKHIYLWLLSKKGLGNRTTSIKQNEDGSIVLLLNEPCMFIEFGKILIAND